MDGFVMSTERLAQTGGSVEQISGSLVREIANMDAMLGEIRAGWASTHAAPRFASVMTAYLQDATTMKNALTSQGATLVSSAQRIAQTEELLAQNLGGAR